MLERTIAGSSNERMVTGMPKGVHKEGLNPAFGLFLSFQPLKGMGSQKGRLVDGCKQTRTKTERENNNERYC